MQRRLDWIPLCWVEMMNPELCSTIFKTVPLASHWPCLYKKRKKKEKKSELMFTLNLWQMLQWFTVQVLLLWWLWETSLSLQMYRVNHLFFIDFSVCIAPPQEYYIFLPSYHFTGGWQRGWCDEALQPSGHALFSMMLIFAGAPEHDTQMVCRCL